MNSNVHSNITYSNQDMKVPIDRWMDKEDIYPYLYLSIYIGFPGGSVVKNLPAKWEIWVQYLRWEDPLEKEMAIHSSQFFLTIISGI